MCVCSNAIAIWGNDLGVMHFSHCVPFGPQGTLGEHWKLHPPTLCCIGRHMPLKHYQLPHFNTLGVPMVQIWNYSFSSDFKSLSCLHITMTQEPQHLRLPLPQVPLMFFKITCQIYCGIYVFPDRLACLKLLLLLLGSYVFNISLIKCWGIVPLVLLFL